MFIDYVTVLQRFESFSFRTGPLHIISSLCLMMKIAKIKGFIISSYMIVFIKLWEIFKLSCGGN